MHKLTEICLPFLLLFLFGCVHIPEYLHIEGDHGSFLETRNDSTCWEVLPQSGKKTTLNSQKFRLLNWNIYKTRSDGWSRDLHDLAQDCDILTLQEGYVIEELRTFLDSNNYHWNIVSAFTYKNVSAGVLTATRVEPDLLCFYREAEPLFRIPKTALITRYKLTLTEKKLMVVNLHSVNFSLGYGSFSSQLEALTEVMEDHDGPLILTGDMNTWSVERQSIVNSFCNRFGLKKIEFPEGSVTSNFGNPLDHVYFRGLRPLEVKAVEVRSSDHNPLVVTFSITRQE